MAVETVYRCDICRRALHPSVLLGAEIVVGAGPLGKSSVRKCHAPAATFHFCGECVDEIHRNFPARDD